MPTTNLSLSFRLFGHQCKFAVGYLPLHLFSDCRNYVIILTGARSLTELNVAISVMSLFFLLTKLIMYIMNIWFPIVSLFVNIAMVALYAVSAYGQIGPDYTDSRYPAPAAWYFRYGCSLAKQYNAYTNCQLAQSSLGLTLYMM